MDGMGSVATHFYWEQAQKIPIPVSPWKINPGIHTKLLEYS